MLEQYFFTEFVTHAAKLLCAMSYADAYENDEIPGLPGAPPQTDWMDAVPAWVPWYLWGFEISLILGSTNITPCDLVKKTVLENNTNLDPNTTYEEIGQMRGPRGRNMIEYLASCFVFEITGTGVSITDDYWEWAEEYRQRIKDKWVETPHFPTVVPDWETLQEENNGNS